MSRTDLNEGWSVRPIGESIPASIPDRIPAIVPGCIHTDLLTAGLIPDPYLDTNEALVQWIGRTDFTYETRFAASFEGFERVDLVCEGLDTVATLSLNGTELGTTRNQHRSYRFDVGQLLHAGGNDLSVTFSSALNYAELAETRLGHKPFVGNAYPYNAIRKMASNFGWDWGPVLITAGIWRPIYLHAWSNARLASVTPLAIVTDEMGTVDIAVSTERTHDRPLTVRASLHGHGAHATVTSTSDLPDQSLKLVLDDPELWWPRGYGEHPLYQLTVELLDGGNVVDTFVRQIGFRTIDVRDEPDEFGTGFAFYVNDERVFIKGANWIPDDCFVSRVTATDYADGVRDATDAGINLLRIWGGGIYESDLLYDLCDRAGVMVWQDFLFACAAYSESAELWDEVEAEVRENVVRLAPHASLVFYNGSNENVEGYYHWGWKEEMEPGEAWGSGYYDNLLPTLLAELDPTRPYRPSSPFSPVDSATPRDPDNGTVHNWEVWNREDYTGYRSSVPRFVSEFGFQGPPNFATIARSIHDDPLTPESTGMLWHQKAEDGNGKLRRGYAPHLPEPTTFEDWHFTTQLNQARAISYGIEHFRSHYPRTMGSIIWQLNDCWPVTSWAAVDGDRRRKPLWYALRALNADRLLTFQPRGGGLAIIASNDSGEHWYEQIIVHRMTLGGDQLASQTVILDAPARTNVTMQLSSDVAASTDPTAEVIVVDSVNARRALWYFVEDRDLALPAFAARHTVRRIAAGYEIEVTAEGFVKDFALNPDRLDPAATVSDMMLTMLPGESTTVIVTSDRDLDELALFANPVVQSVNHLLDHSRMPVQRS